MAVYTDVAADELADFLSLYDLGELLSYKGIAEGVENSNFLLHTTRGSFILTLYEKRVEKDDLPFFLALMTHLASHGISCPQPVKNRKGEALRLALRQAGGDHHLSRRRLAAQAERGALRRRRTGAGEDASRRARISRSSRANALSVSGWRPLFDLAAKSRRQRAAGPAATSSRASSIISRAASGRRACRRA